MSQRTVRQKEPTVKLPRDSPNRIRDSSDSSPLPTKILDFGGFDSSAVLIFRGGILVCTGSLARNGPTVLETPPKGAPEASPPGGLPPGSWQLPAAGMGLERRFESRRRGPWEMLSWPGTLAVRTGCTASCRKLNLEKWAQPLGDLNFPRAFRIEHAMLLRPCKLKIMRTDRRSTPNSRAITSRMFARIRMGSKQSEKTTTSLHN